jgi:hypothetical protein
MSADDAQIKDDWKACLQALEKSLATAVASAENGRLAAGDVQNLAQQLHMMDGDNWDNNRKVYTWGRLKLDLAVAAADAGLAPWWAVMTGRAYAGDLEGMRHVYDLTHRKSFDIVAQRPSLDSVVTWLSRPYKIGDGYSNNITPQVLQQLFDWGADPNHDEGKWLTMALKDCDAPVINVWLDNGAALKTVTQVISSLNGRNAERQTLLISCLAGRTYYEAMDDNTLLETKFMPDVNGASTLKTLFNFKAQRVMEIYESARPLQPVMTSAAFEDFSAAAVDAARDKLQSLTGKPVAEAQRPGKLAKPKLQFPAPSSSPSMSPGG